MAYQLSTINDSVRTDPAAFLAQCDGAYQKRVEEAADRIIERLDISPIVLLSGPSGSGKTTTALKIEEELERRGIVTHTISLDNYFKTLNKATAPRTPEGDLDFESPLCLDMELLDEWASGKAEIIHPKGTTRESGILPIRPPVEGLDGGLEQVPLLGEPCTDPLVIPVVYLDADFVAGAGGHIRVLK